MSERNDGLKKTTTRGFVWSLGSAVSQAVLQIGSVAVLARLLNPSDFGVVTAATLIVGLANIIGQLGISAAIIQTRQLTKSQIIAGTYLAFGASLILGLLVWILSPVLNPLVGLPSSSNIMRLLAITLPILGLTMVPLGVLQRELRFRALAVVDTSAYLIGIVGVGIFLAASGVGAASLVYAQIVDATLTVVGYLFLSRMPWPRISLHDGIRDARGILKFGLPFSVGQIGNWIAQNADNFVVAARLPTASLGIYNRAYQLLAAPANLIGGVADKVLYPAMSKVQGDLARMSRAYVSASAFVALVTIPASIILLVGAPAIVALLLGPKWVATVAPLQIFAVVLLPRTSYKISGSFTRARGAVVGGATRQWLYALEVVVFCFLGSFWGVEGVAAGASAAVLLHYLTMVHFSAQVAHGLWGQLGKMYLRYLPLAAADVVAAFVGFWLVQQIGSPLLTLAVISAFVLAMTATIALLFRRVFEDEMSLFFGILGSINLRRVRR